jgi:hypothetical protein
VQAFKVAIEAAIAALFVSVGIFLSLCLLLAIGATDDEQAMGVVVMIVFYLGIPFAIFSGVTAGILTLIKTWLWPHR